MLEIKVQDKSITTVQKAVFIRGTVGEKVAISCDEEWGNRLKTVVFKRLDPCAEPIVNYIGVVSKTEVVIPHEILHESGKFHIGLYSVMGAETTPTFWSEVFEIEYGTDTDGVAPQPPTPSEYSQLIQLAEETKEIANSVREDADSGIFDGEKGQKGADGADGFSPTVDVEQIECGHRVTITDKNGENIFDVMDGQGGGESGGTTNYEELPDKPKINGVELSGNKTTQDLGIKIPTKLSELENDSGYITPTAISEHNTSKQSHNDIRLEIQNIAERLNAFFDTDDTTLDELSEIIEYITNNKTLIESITTSKVSVSDIVNNLTTNVANKPLSAAQGVVLKKLIDTLTSDLNNYALKTDIPKKVSQLENDKGYLTEHQDISGKLDASKLPEAINDALEQAKASGEFDGKDGADGKDGSNGKDGVSATHSWNGTTLTVTSASGTSSANLKGDKGEQGIQGIQGERGLQGVQGEKGDKGDTGTTQVTPLFANSIEECTDTSKLYVLPDGFIYAWMLTEVEVETGGGCTNLIDGTKGYIKEGYRYSASSAAFKSYAPTDYTFASIVIPVPTSGDLTIRVRGMAYRTAYPTIYGGTTNSAFTNCFSDKVTTDTYDTNGDWIFTLSNTAGVSYIVTGGELTVDTSSVIATVNEEIVEGSTEIVTEYAWVSTGHAFVPANYEGRIIDLENEVSQHKIDIANLKKGITSSTPIKDWDTPIYDANIPVFELSAEKAAMTNAANTPANIYAKYDALMTKHPRYITKTDLGLCSDGVNHVYRYDFREPEPLHESNKVWSETKAKAIIVTGIHFEWAGIYAMYNALEEIADNPELRNFRRNTHLIVVPVANPYATIASNYQSGLPTPNSYGVRNANGVEIHRNFEVDWVLTEEGTTHYGGASPLSEVETQYVDNIMKNNTDAALFLSCHNCGVDTFWGTGFIWASTATKYMCNMGYRVIDKLSNAWMDKYGDTLSAGIAEYKTDLLEDGETRLGWAGLSTSAGTEAKQATKYGIQGTNVEICDPFQIHGTKANPEPALSSFTMSRGAEVCVNFLLTAFGVYDPKDKKDYAPNLPWSE